MWITTALEPRTIEWPFPAPLLGPSSPGDDAESWTILDQDPDEIETGSDTQQDPAPISVLRGASRVQPVGQDDHGELVQMSPVRPDDLAKTLSYY